MNKSILIFHLCITIHCKVILASFLLTFNAANKNKNQYNDEDEFERVKQAARNNIIGSKILPSHEKLTGLCFLHPIHSNSDQVRTLYWNCIHLQTPQGSY